VKSTGVGGEARGYDGGKQISRGENVTSWSIRRAFCSRSRSTRPTSSDRDGIKLLLEDAKESFPRMRHLWLDAGYNGEGKGKDRVEKVLGWTAQIA
jgi:putative transposase